MGRRLRHLIALLLAVMALLPLQAAADPAEEAHEHVLQHILFSSGTCTLDGTVEHYRCTECGERFWDPEGTDPIEGKEWSIPTEGHAWSEWEIVESDCQTQGSRHRVCTVCGAEEDEALPLAGHTWDEWSEATATCTEDGMRERTCTVCGEVEAEEVPATGHAWTEVPYKDPTCTEAGNSAYAQCENCGMIVGDPSTMDALDTIPYTPSTGHDWGSWYVAAEPTCYSYGAQARTCSRCGATETLSLATTDHSWGSWQVSREAGCTEPGEESRSCTVCGLTETRDTGEPLGHSWDKGTVTKAATATADGERTFTCVRCGEARTEAIAKIGKQDDPKADGNGSVASGTKPSPAPRPELELEPEPEPAPERTKELSILSIIAGAIGIAALLGIIMLLAGRRLGEDPDPESEPSPSPTAGPKPKHAKPAHLKQRH